MQVYRDWEVCFWDENARQCTASGTENVTALENRAPHQFYMQVREQYPGPSTYKTTLRREDGSIEQEKYTLRVLPEYPRYFESKHELRALLSGMGANCLDELNFVKEMRNASIRDMIIAIWYTFKPILDDCPIENLLFIKDWCDEKISDEAAESKFQEFIQNGDWKILFEMQKAHRAGIPPSQFLFDAHRERGVLFFIKVLKDEFKIDRHLGELNSLFGRPEDLDRLFANLE